MAVLKKESIQSEERIQVQNRESLYLLEQDTIYYLIKGHAELYIGETGSSQKTQSKTFLFSVNEGGIFFSLPFRNNEKMLIVDLMPNSTVVKWSWSDFLQQVQRQYDTLAAFENWINQLCKCLNFATSSKIVTSIETDDDYYIIEEETIYAAKGILWVTPYIKNVKYLDHFEVMPQQYIPLNMTSWIKADAVNKLTVMPTIKFIFSHYFKKSFNLYLQYMADAFVIKEQMTNLQKQKRMRLHNQTLLFHQSTTSPILLCCQWLCAAAGMDANDFMNKTKYARMTTAEEIFHEAGISYEKIQLQGEWWKNGSVPLLGSWQDGRPVVLIPTTRGKYRYKDVFGSGTINKRNVQLLQPVAMKLSPKFRKWSMQIKNLLGLIFL